MSAESFVVKSARELNHASLSESAVVLNDVLEQIKPIVESRRRLTEQEQNIQGAIVKLTAVIEDLQQQFNLFKNQKNVNAELEREVLGKIKSKLGE